MEKISEYAYIKYKDGLFEIKNTKPSEDTVKAWNYLLDNFKELEGVKNIEIHFKNFDHITDDEIEVFSNLLEQNTSFESVALNFEGCPNIADSGINDLAEVLKSMKKLKRIELTVGNELISDYSIEVLGAAAAECPNLESVGFIFIGCPDISDEGFQNYMENISKMKSLTNLKIGFHSCENITDFSITTIFSNKKLIQNLSGLGLEFKDSALTKEAM